MRLLVVFLLAAALLLAGCASIPLSTAIRLSSLEPRTLAQVDPAQVRVRVSIPVGYELNVDTTRLTLALSAPSGRKESGMNLRLLRMARETRSAGWFTPDVPVSTYELALTPDGARELRSMQQFVLAENPNKFEFGVSAPLARTPDNPREMAFWADLKLSAQEQYVPLINGARLKFKVDAGNGG